MQEGLQPGLFSENLVFGEILHFTTFAKYFFINYKHLEQLWELANFTPALISHSIITMLTLHSKLAGTAIFRKFSICEISHFTTFAESWFSNLTSGLGNFATIYYTIVSLLRQSFSESLDSGLPSEKLAICEVSHFTNFNRRLVYFPWIKN